MKEIVERHAVPRGWPGEVAVKYLTEYLKYDVGPRQIEAVGLFHRLAKQHGALEGEVRGVEVVGPVGRPDSVLT